MRRAHAIELFPHAVLELEVLGNRFDHDVAGAEGGHLGREVESFDRHVAIDLGELPLLDEFVERFEDSGLSLVQRTWGYFTDRSGKPGRGGNLGDTAAHEPAAEDADVFDFGHCFRDSMVMVDGR